MRFRLERVALAEEAAALRDGELSNLALLAEGRDPNAPTGRWEQGDFAFRLIPFGVDEQPDPEITTQLEWNPDYEDEEGRGAWPGTVLGDPAGTALNNHFGPSGMNSASSPSPRNHATIASCGGTSVP